MNTYTTAMMSAPGQTVADSDGDGQEGGHPDDEPVTLGAYLASRPSNHPPQA